MKSSILSVLAFVIAAPVLYPQSSASLNSAEENLQTGRLFLVGFPQSKTRKQLRADYLGTDQQSPSTLDLKFHALRDAVDLSIEHRLYLGENAASSEHAQLIAWESLEALLQGQLVAGNASLLKASRVAFPNPPTGNPFSERPEGETQLPLGVSRPSNSAVAASDGSYAGSNMRDYAYAQLHFKRGVIAALDFIRSDLTGEIRSLDLLNFENFPQYTAFNTEDLLDSNFGEEPVPSQTLGYLLGNALDRYGKSTIGIGDRLWRAAYFDSDRGPRGSRSSERQTMLDAATTELRKGAHFQYMAAVVLAAQMGDGSENNLSEYYESRVDQSRVSSQNASVYIDRIRRGEVPRLTNLALAASTSGINSKIQLVTTFRNNANQKYAEAETAIWRVKESEAQAISDAQALRTQFSNTLAALTGIPLGGESEEPYFGLISESGRNAYKAAVQEKIEAALSADDESTILSDGSELGQAILQYRRALAEARSAKSRIDSIPQQIRIEEVRVGAVNGVILETENEISAYRLALAVANSISISVGTSGNGAYFAVSTNPNAILVGVLESRISRAQTIQNVRINEINAEATIRNLLLLQNQYLIDLEISGIQIQQSIAGINAIRAEIERQIENHIYYQDSNRQKWYSDPALVFEREIQELEYEDSLREYVAGLYELSQLLAFRWAEDFENPYTNRLNNPVALGQGLFDDFSQAESIFAVADVSHADSFFLALQRWDEALRNERAGGDIANITAQVSLRRDVLGLSEIEWNPDSNRFIINEETRELSLRRFRAILLREAAIADDDYWLRLNFSLDFGQRLRSSLIQGTSTQPLLFPMSKDDWNLRVTGISARIEGSNVAQSSNNRYRVELYQFGTVSIPKYYPRNTTDKALKQFSLPLYYSDPEGESISPFKFTLNAGINNESGQGPGGTPGTISTDLEPSPYCSNYVLLIEKSANQTPINIGNIEDIVFHFELRVGRPPAFAW
jgi:hypothetical protein